MIADNNEDMYPIVDEEGKQVVASGSSPACFQQ